jgi:hypothetical protein
MFIFDRFLCCISLKLFGKAVGWIGTVVSFMTAYALFLVVSAKSRTVFTFKEKYFGDHVNQKGDEREK